MGGDNRSDEPTVTACRVAVVGRCCSRMRPLLLLLVRRSLLDLAPPTVPTFTTVPTAHFAHSLPLHVLEQRHPDTTQGVARGVERMGWHVR